MKAYELYLRGRQAFVRYTKSGYQESIEWFRKAIEEDPQYALAYAAMALAWVELAESGLSDPVRAHAHAREAAAKALELDNELAEAHATLGYLQFTADFDWTRSEASFRRALELNPGVADTYDDFGRMLGSVGRFDESLEMLKRARELDPLAHRIDLATGLIRAGRYDEAIETAGHAITLDPKYPRARATLGWAYFLKGEQAEGLAAMEMAVSLAPDERGWLAQLGEAYAMAGRLDDARRVLAQLQRRRRVITSPRITSPTSIRDSRSTTRRSVIWNAPSSSVREPSMDSRDPSSSCHCGHTRGSLPCSGG